MKRVLPAFCSFCSAGMTSFERDLDIHAVVGVLGGQRIVQLEEIDVIHAEACQALVHRLRDELGDPRAVGRLQPELGAEHDVGLQRLQHAAEVALGLAVAVERGGVDVVDAELDGARDRPLLVGRRALGHQAADGAGAEAEHGNFEASAAQFTLLHFSCPPLQVPPPSSARASTHLDCVKLTRCLLSVARSLRSVSS